MEIKLNLIPLKKKEDIVKKNRVSVAIKVESFLTIVLVVFLVMLLSFNYILNLNLNSVIKAGKKSENSGKYDRLKEYDENFSRINQRLANAISIKNDQLYWSKLFLKLNDYVFSGIEINTINTSDYIISLQGTSDTRDDLILFKEKLSSEECFSNINLPLDDLVDKNNIRFKIDFYINKNCLKN